jgi:hypothetical protein
MSIFSALTTSRLRSVIDFIAVMERLMAGKSMPWNCLVNKAEA